MPPQTTRNTIEDIVPEPKVGIVPRGVEIDEVVAASRDVTRSRRVEQCDQSRRTPAEHGRAPT
jgi:hypothetical protein